MKTIRVNTDVTRIKTCRMNYGMWSLRYHGWMWDAYAAEELLETIWNDVEYTEEDLLELLENWVKVYGDLQKNEDYFYSVCYADDYNFCGSTGRNNIESILDGLYNANRNLLNYGRLVMEKLGYTQLQTQEIWDRVYPQF